MKMIKRTLRERLFETPWRPLDKDRPQTEAERMQERAQKARTTAEALGVSSIDPLLMPRRRDQQTPDRFRNECAACGQTCRFGPHGPYGERQCEYCGEPPRSY